MPRLDPNAVMAWPGLGSMAGSAIAKIVDKPKGTGAAIAAGVLIKIMQGLFEDRRNA